MGMKAQLRIGGEAIKEEIDVDNGLRQGCTMAPTLFNPYSCLVAERWKACMASHSSVGICLCYKDRWEIV